MDFEEDPIQTLLLSEIFKHYRCYSGRNGIQINNKRMQNKFSYLKMTGATEKIQYSEEEERCSNL